MSVNQGKIIKAVRMYIDGKSSIQELRSTFGTLYYFAKKRNELDAQGSTFVGRIMAILAEFSRGHRTEHSVLEELANAIRPFEPRGVSYAITAIQVSVAFRRPQNITLGSDHSQAIQARAGGSLRDLELAVA